MPPRVRQNSFERWTVDLNHTLYLYGNAKAADVEYAINMARIRVRHVNNKCPEIPHSRNLNGSITARLLLSESINSATSAVPFYFQQTLGGQDINSAMALGSYQDYRYRAPNLLLLQESFEHSIWGPFGFKFMADQGRVALTRGDLGFSHLRHSLCGGIHVARGRVPHGSIDVCLGRAGGASQHLQHEQLRCWVGRHGRCWIRDADQNFAAR